MIGDDNVNNSASVPAVESISSKVTGLENPSIPFPIVPAVQSSSADAPREISPQGRYVKVSFSI